MRRVLKLFRPEPVIVAVEEAGPRFPEENRRRPWELSFPQSANVEDIFFCFRLVLGRNPNREEWAGHSSRAGEPLSDVFRTYVNSGEFKARNLLAAEMPPGIVKRHNGRFEVFANPEDLVIGSPVLANCYEESVTKVVESLLKPGDLFLDVGANIGYFALLGATLVGPEGQVFAVEPNDFNVKLLEASRRANGFDNISVMQVAVGERIETLALHSTIGNGSTAELGEHEIFSGRIVPGFPLDVLMSRRDRKVALIKIDVEGFEYQALRGAERLLAEDRPPIVFEFSAGGIVGIDGIDFLRWLEAKGYRFVNISTDPDFNRRQTPEEIMADFHAAMVDHIDVLAQPIDRD